MDKELKQAWVTALRSGEYKQGYGGFKSNNETYCCLGVLCDVLAKQDKGYWDSHHLIDYYIPFIYTEDNNQTCNTAKLRESTMYSIEFPLNIQSILMDMNDRERASFQRIADFIDINF